MRSVRLQNFRSFRDTGRITLRPITILVGTNSSGKSSFLRFFPLLRQTAETPTRSPLLWFGKLVDFGDFSSAASFDQDSMSLEFELELDLAAARFWLRSQRGKLNTIRLTIELKASRNRTYVSSLVVECETDVARIVFNDQDEVTTFTVNDIDVCTIYGNQRLHVVPARFVPSLTFEPETDRRSTPIHDALAKTLKSLAHNRTSNKTIRNRMSYLHYGHPDTMLTAVRDLGLRFLAEPTEDNKDFKHIRALLLAKDIGFILHTVQRALGSFASGISYIGPFRTDPERFYRQQELAVGHIEPHGENFAMFLRSLTPTQLSNLSEFVREHLGVRVDIQAEGSHVAILVQDESGRGVNLIDMGYGLSQVLPVLAQCWTTADGSLSERERSTTVLAIEQPELHLHPSHQAQLADMFAAVLRRVREQPSGRHRLRLPDRDSLEFPLRILIETHSEMLVNRLGELISAGTLEPQDVSVLLFERGTSSAVTTIREAHFSSDGILENWPLGFFAP